MTWLWVCCKVCSKSVNKIKADFKIFKLNSEKWNKKWIELENRLLKLILLDDIEVSYKPNKMTLHSGTWM